MKPPKNHYPIIAAAALGLGGLIPVSFGGEKEPSPEQTVVVAAKQDPVQAHLDEIIVSRLNLQAKFRSSFSRRKPTESTSYQLVENTENTAAGERHFQVMQKTTSFMKGRKTETKEFLKVRFVEKTNETLVDLKGAWVKPDDHPIVKMLPKPKPAKNITP